MTKSNRFSSTRRLILALAACALVANLVPAMAAEREAGDVTLTVKYTGKGDVDAKHQIWVWIFDTPDIGPGSMPVGEMSLAKNGGDVTFPAVAGDKVWIAVAYDQAGGFAEMAPPPSGSPVKIHSTAAGAPEPVTPGGKTKVAVTFDDKERMP